MRCSIFIATSLDGYISAKDGSIDWLDALNALVPEGEDCGFHAFMDSVDVLVMGRNTFEQVITFDTWFYGTKPIIVLSSGSVHIPAKLSETVSVSNESPAALVARLHQNGIKRIYIDGGITIQGFLSAGLVTDLTITQVPIILGEGRPLFGHLPHAISLEHSKTSVFPFGFVQSVYRLKS